MKPESIKAVVLALGHDYGRESVERILAAFTTTPEYQEMVKDAELGRAWIWQFSENNDDATPETFRTLRDRTQERADDIDAARNG